MWKFIDDHSLSAFIFGLYLVFVLALWMLPDGRLQAMAQGHADDTFGALIIVLGARYFWERGSDPAKPPEKKKGS